ncbi:LysR family transcriptional regulator [Gordonia insulae]|uniref:Hydrogen peroxide-inducible genes activator n=1 Tax=Gordonia insulae TaxID=2420509 RepID=A0A3G8JT60_9ACTN|nr:LysR family transcriptional regulator [Gordonia insulae]AZG48066.1 Hydrogen peroxide-inducible genes activator [Gordonia insulae]
MQFRQLEYFVALAREQHFARAAAACYVSQPALSEAIRKLERELGVPLVRRGSSFEGLTPEGERLVLGARRILAERESLEHEVAALHTGLTGELRIGVIPAATTAIADRVDPFCAAHPLVRLRIESALRSADIVERLRRFELDIGILYTQGVDTTGLVKRPLYDEQHVLVVGNDLLPGRTGAATWADIAELPMCLLHKGMRGRDRIDEAATAHGVTITPRLEADSISTLLAFVSRGGWASIVPRVWVQRRGAPTDFRVVELEDEALSGHVALVRVDVEPASVLVKAFEDMAMVLAAPPASGRITSSKPEA